MKIRYCGDVQHVRSVTVARSRNTHWHRALATRREWIGFPLCCYFFQWLVGQRTRDRVCLFASLFFFFLGARHSTSTRLVTSSAAPKNTCKFVLRHVTTMYCIRGLFVLTAFSSALFDAWGSWSTKELLNACHLLQIYKLEDGGSIPGQSGRILCGVQKYPYTLIKLLVQEPILIIPLTTECLVIMSWFWHVKLLDFKYIFFASSNVQEAGHKD